LDLSGEDCGPAGLTASVYAGKEDVRELEDVLMDVPKASEVQDRRETGRSKYPPAILGRTLLACNSLTDLPFLFLDS
jgi:hypothetical protein